MAKEVSMEFAFFEFLRSFYLDNKGIIRNRYREITKKYLDYNDKEKNPDAFLRKPQFEALEMYVFVKEFMDNQQMYQIFDDWSKRNGVFADRRFYDESGQLTLYDVYSPKQYHDYFLQIKKYAEAKKIDKARTWMKTRKFTHIYIPMFDQQSIYTAVKKVKHTQGLDVLIVDYFKGSGDGDAFDSYQELGRFVDKYLFT